MNCANHPEQPAVAFCRTCGKAVCQSCQRPAQGTIFCEEHLPVPAASPYTTPPLGAVPAEGPSPYSRTSAASPGLAFVLGFIPGVGAVYNGQYAKGLIHAVAFGLLVSIQSADAAPGLEWLLGCVTAAFVFYMAFEAFHTAKRRQLGEVVDEFSSLVSLGQSRAAFPVGPIVLIAMGVIFLLNTLEIVRLYDIVRFWPVFLIAFGAYLLYVRVMERSDDAATRAQELGHE